MKRSTAKDMTWIRTDELDALRAENERLRQDEKRLNALAVVSHFVRFGDDDDDDENPRYSCEFEHLGYMKPVLHKGWGRTMREAIDAAIATKSEKVDAK